MIVACIAYSVNMRISLSPPTPPRSCIRIDVRLLIGPYLYLCLWVLYGTGTFESEIEAAVMYDIRAVQMALDAPDPAQYWKRRTLFNFSFAMAGLMWAMTDRQQHTLVRQLIAADDFEE